MTNSDENNTIQSLNGKYPTKIEDRLEALEIRIAYLDDTVELLSNELGTMTKEFIMAKEALQMMYQKLEQSQGESGIELASHEPPPPHY
ncbi:MAG: SlyX family protein [Oleibacter sp.]|nr:SlyX family protein [Thalassolituus sp.]